MAYEQPRVPEFRDGGNMYTLLRGIVLFLKGFCMAAWKANNKRIAEIEDIKKRLAALEGGE